MQAFRPEPFWQIQFTYRPPADPSDSHAPQIAQPVTFFSTRGRIFDRLACLVLFELCVEEPEAIVTKVKITLIL